MRLSLFNSKLLAVAVALIGCCVQLNAAISEGPATTNSVQAEQRRIEQFYHAQQSFQEQLLVGQRRYNDRQAARAKVIASMAAQLHSREQTVAIQPTAAVDASTEIRLRASSPWLAIAGLIFLFAGVIYFWNRPRSASDSRVPYEPVDFDTQRRFIDEAAKAKARTQDAGA